MEEREICRTATDIVNLLQSNGNACTLDADRPLGTRNLSEIEELLREVERHLWPFLNAIRKARGKKPVYAPRE